MTEEQLNYSEQFEGSNALESDRERCLDCGGSIAESSLYQRYRVCPHCRYHYHLPAAQRIETLSDPGTFRETNAGLVPLDPLSFEDNVPYRERLKIAQHNTGLMEAAITGTAYVGGMPAVLAVVDFGFMNGSVGSAAGEKITQAAELALQKRSPLVLVSSGGGPRMQEGILSVMQMAKTVSAIKRLARRGVPFISVLANPTTGPLYAGAASMADIILSEPNALIGFAPLREAREATAGPLPTDFHTAKFHVEHGMIDGIVDRQRMKQQMALVLDLLGFRYRLTATNRTSIRQVEHPEAPAWDRVQMARHRHRPTARDYIERIVSNFVELHGDRVYGDDPAVVTGLGYLSGEAVMIIGTERGRGADASICHEGRIYPEGFRKAERAMKLAEKFKLPVISLIDTLGAYQGLEAEERGIGSAISSSMATMSDLRTPIIAAIIGQGGSEAALALSIADRTLMMENAICTPVAPEAAAWILYRDAERADEVAASLKLTAKDCNDLGIVEVVVAEPEGGAHTDFDEAAHQLERSVVRSLLEVQMTFNRSLLKNRFQKFRRMGTYSTYFHATLSSEAVRLQDLVRRGVQELRDRLQGKIKPDDSYPHGEVHHSS